MIKLVKSGIQTKELNYSRYLKKNKLQLNQLLFSADGKYAATGSLRFNFFVAFSQDGKFLVTGSSDKTCKVWNTEKGFELIDTIKGYTKQIDAITFSSDNQYIATGSDDKTCKIWNEKKGFESINQIKNHSKQIYSVAFSPDGKYLVTCSRDNA
ncbi:hypothetical protein ABPG73_000231 [Tetrahymena malaccensis]